VNLAESSYQQGEMMEGDHKCIMIIGGIKIFLPNSPVEASTSVSHEKVMQQESKKEAMGPNDFKYNFVCDAGATEEGKLVVTVMMKDHILESFQGEEEEEKTIDMLTQWQMELKMLEDWLENIEPEGGFQETVIHIVGEEHSIELLKHFSPGAEQKMTVALDPAVEYEAYNIDFVEFYEEL
jgi:hypothetical protein